MTARLPDHLDLIASAPDGIRKLRGLILELAVRGKLVAQDPNDEAEVTTLSSIGKWAVGSGFPTAEQGNTGLEILFAKVSDMNLPENSHCINTTNHTISRESAKRLRVNIHPAGTVVFPKIGGAIATNKRRILTRDTAIDNNCLGITPREGILSEWLFVLLTAIDLTKYQAGTSVPALAQGVLAEIPVLLPSKAEQHRIVAKVDELMALCDRLETEQVDAESAQARLVDTLLGTLTKSTDAADLAANWQRLAEHFDTLFTNESSLDALKQTILQLAVMGKLVPQNPSDEPASELLKRIAKERARMEAEGACKKLKPLPPVREDERPFEVSNQWLWVRLSTLVSILGDGLHGTPNYTRGAPYYFINGNNLVDGAIIIKPDTKTVSESEFNKHRKPLSDSSILVSINGSLGRVAFYRGEQVVLGKSACFFNLLPQLEKHYIRLILESLYFLDYAFKGATGTTIRNLGLKAMNDFPVPLPPLAEQHRIVAKVDELMALVDRLKADLAESRSQQERLAATLIESALQAA